jgi:sulfur-oxidizing protein SoxZ
MSPQPRVQVPATAQKGETFRIKTLINHQMETGLRQDDKGNAIPRRIINRFECRFNGTAVFSVDLREAFAANPFIEFHLRASESGRFAFIWEEDGGAIYRLQHDFVVT